MSKKQKESKNETTRKLDMDKISTALELTKIEIDVEKKFIDKIVFGTTAILGAAGIIAKLSNFENILKAVIVFAIVGNVVWIFWFILINTNKQILKKFKFHYIQIKNLKK